MVATEQEYLREVQYRYPDRLRARAMLHVRYGRGDWFTWLAGAVPLAAGSVVADIGCGDGAFWTNAPPSVPDLTLRLFDLSPGMIEAAERALAASGRWRDVRATVADAAGLPLGNDSVDTALAIHMLYHLPDPAAGVRELRRVLRPDGVAAVMLNPAGTMAELSALIDDALARDPSQRHEPLTSEAATPLLADAFGSVERVRFDDRLVVTDPIDLLAYLLSLPVATGADAQAALARAVGAAFARSDSAFRISKSADLLLCRR